MADTWLITGGAGFIGSNLVRFVRTHRPDVHLINADALTYSGNLENFADLENDPKHEFVKADVCNADAMRPLVERADKVLHLAAESHVDRSIIDSTPFIDTNVRGTQILLDLCREVGGRRFVYVSTDEVYGSLPLEDTSKLFTEETPLAPNSPYAASKAAGDLLVRAAFHTFGSEVMATRCSNNFGPYQFPEKVIPLFVSNLLEGKKLPLYGDGKNVRDWLHVDDHAEAIVRVLEEGKPGEVYNVGGNNERSNLELTTMILEAMGHGPEMIEPVADRLGHDRRYAIDASKIERELGWTPSRSAWPGALHETVQWYVDNRAWWERVKDGSYRAYYETQYGTKA